jgi:hypothetical protein
MATAAAGRSALGNVPPFQIDGEVENGFTPRGERLTLAAGVVVQACPVRARRRRGVRGHVPVSRAGRSSREPMLARQATTYAAVPALLDSFFPEPVYGVLWCRKKSFFFVRID